MENVGVISYMPHIVHSYLPSIQRRKHKRELERIIWNGCYMYNAIVELEKLQPKYKRVVLVNDNYRYMYNELYTSWHNLPEKRVLHFICTAHSWYAIVILSVIVNYFSLQYRIKENLKWYTCWCKWTRCIQFLFFAVNHRDQLKLRVIIISFL